MLFSLVTIGIKQSKQVQYFDQPGEKLIKIVSLKVASKTNK